MEPVSARRHITSPAPVARCHWPHANSTHETTVSDALTQRRPRETETTPRTEGRGLHDHAGITYPRGLAPLQGLNLGSSFASCDRLHIFFSSPRPAPRLATVHWPTPEQQDQTVTTVPPPVATSDPSALVSPGER